MYPKYVSLEVSDGVAHRVMNSWRGAYGARFTDSLCAQRVPRASGFSVGNF